MGLRKILFILVLGCILCIAFIGWGMSVIDNGQEAEELLIEEPEQHTNPQKEVSKSKDKEENAEFVRTTEIPIGQETEEAENPTMIPPVKEMAEFDLPTAEPQVKVTQAPVKPTYIPQVEATEVPEAPKNVSQEKEITTPEPSVVITPQPQITSTPDTPTEVPVQEVHVHDFEKAIWELPTCQKGGYYNNICKSCGLVESVSQESLPHEVEDIVIQEGHCMEDRVIRHICRNCDMQVESDTRYPIYDEHQWEYEEVDGASVEYCERCGVVK